LYDSGAGTLLNVALSTAQATRLVAVIGRLRGQGVAAAQLKAAIARVDAEGNPGTTMDDLSREEERDTDLPGTAYELAKRPDFWGAPLTGTRWLRDPGSGRQLPVRLTRAEGRRLRRVLARLMADGVADTTPFVEELNKASLMMIPASVTIARLRLIQRNLRRTVLVRLRADHRLIRDLTRSRRTGDRILPRDFDTAFQSVEIPGSDPHKGGQVVVFVNYRTRGGRDLRVVYKPADLTIDSLLYNDADSVAANLGTDLSSYRMLSRTDDTADVRHRHYGYMEFVKSGGPQSAAQLRSVFRSLGANLALAYVFGLRDIHKENFLLLDDRIQFIDMEAATGRFTGFGTMDMDELTGRLCEKIADSLRGLGRDAARAEVPSTDDLKSEIRAGFRDKLAEMGPRRGDPHGVDAAVGRFMQATARFVPFKTAELQQRAGLFHGQLNPPDEETRTLYDNSTDRLAREAADEAGAPDGLEAAFQTMLRAPATMAAFHTGDVPFWTHRDRNVYGEDGALQVPDLPHPRLGSTAHNARTARSRLRPERAGVAMRRLNRQALPLFGDIAAKILAKL
ncbi:MAG: DUF4135 domain-containing protein, partial [Rhodovulum sp.]